MEKMIFGQAGASAAQFGLFASLSMLAAIIGFHSVGITLAAVAQTAAVSISLTM